MFQILERLMTGYVQPPREQRKYGWKKDNYTESDIATRPELSQYKLMKYHPCLTDIPIIDLRSKCPPVYNQGQLGSCTANATCGAYGFEMIKQGETYEEMSRLFLYYCSRKAEGHVDEDSGAELKDVVNVTQKIGLCLEKLWPYDISKFTEEPPAICNTDSELHRTAVAERVKQTNDDLKQCLLDGYPVIFGFNVYESFESEQVEKTGIMPMPNTTTEKLLGGHAVLLVGCTQISEKNYYIVRNSWGASWGDNGYFYMPAEFIIDPSMASDFWAIKLVKDLPDQH